MPKSFGDPNPRDAGEPTRSVIQVERFAGRIFPGWRPAGEVGRLPARARQLTSPA